MQQEQIYIIFADSKNSSNYPLNNNDLSMPVFKRSLIIIALLPFIYQSVKSQQVKVIDKTNLQPVQDVFIFDNKHEHTSLTDQLGKADLSNFEHTELIIFQHPSYKTMIVSYQEIKERDFTIKLTQSFIDLSEVVVSAGRWEQRRTETPNKIIQLDTDQIDFYNPQTTADLLSTSNEVFVQKSQLGGGSPMIRGFSANSVLIVVDGVRMNNAIFRSGNLHNVISIDPNMLERSEVILGPGSVIYGSDALGGVMNFRTKQARLGSLEKTYISASALTRYASADQEKTLHANVNLGWEKWAITTGITYSSFDHLRAGSNYPDDYPEFGKRTHYADRIDGRDSIVENPNENVQKPSAYDQIHFTQKIRFRPGENFDLNYGLHYSKTSNIPRYDRLTLLSEDHFKYAEWYYGPQKWMLHNFQATIRNITGLFDRAKISLAYQNYQESRHDRKLYNDIKRHRTEMLDILTFNTDMEKSLSAASTLYYGTEAIWNAVTSRAERENILTSEKMDEATRYPSGGSHYSTIAAYAFYKQQFQHKLTFNAGIRYSYIDLGADFSGCSRDFYDLPYKLISLNTSALNGISGLTYRPVKDWQLKLSLSSGFRAPNIDDMAKVFDSEPGNVVVPNNDLEPEYSYNAESSIIGKFGKYARLELTGYYTWLNNAMVRRNYTFNGRDSIMYDGQLSNVQALVNENSAFIYGGSVKVNAEISNRWSSSINYNLTQGEDKQGIPLRHVTPGFGNLNIIYRANQFKASFFINYNDALKLKDMAPCEKNKTHMYTRDGSPQWYTVNLIFSWQIHKMMQVNLGCKNILDRHYRPYGSGISAPGRNFIISLKGNFNNAD
ncbi:MAG: TonB-dependent receptor [Bacteroidales bacterium]